ncbi:MAG: hypothetical protein U0441_14835 [Polyangiaceae bacterium]
MTYPDPSEGSFCSGWAPIGAECTTAWDCESFRCTTLGANDQGATGICTRTPCANDASCGDGGVCVHEPIGDNAFWCKRGCASDVDCLAPFVCLANGTCGVTVPTTP